jgi:transposase
MDLCYNKGMDNIIENTQNWQEKCQQFEYRIAELEALVKHYEELIRLAAHQRFGASSEKTVMAEQLSLFNEAEATADDCLPEPTLEEVTYTRRKRVGKREEDLFGLPVEVIEYTLPEEEQVCPECGEALHTMGHETRRELTVIPAQIKVTEHRIAVYSCRNCEKEAERVPMIKASAPEPVIKGSLASPSAVAHIMTQKFIMYAPLYRQEASWKRQGVALSRQTMANWVIRCAQDWLLPIYLRLMALLLTQNVLHADETTLKVLREPDRAANTKSYMWLYRTSGDTQTPIVLYDYQQTRSGRHPKEFLSGFSGFLHTDGYAGYHSLSNMTVVGCWAHMKRKFEDTLKAMPPDSRPGSAARKGEAFCNKLFAFEREYETLSAEKRYEKRLEESRPLAEAFFAWAESVPALPKSTLGGAICYAKTQKQWLMHVYLDGRLELSNNRAERSIKPFVMGRKNFLFCNTPKGAEASAIIYSMIETAKENGLNPFEYLKYLFETMPNATTGMIDSLLPWSETLPDCCRIPIKTPKEDTHGNVEH